MLSTPLSRQKREAHDVLNVLGELTQVLAGRPHEDQRLLFSDTHTIPLLVYWCNMTKRRPPWSGLTTRAVRRRGTNASIP